MIISLKQLFSKYKKQISFTFFLLSFEAILVVFIPFYMAKAIDDLIISKNDGVYSLAFIFFLILVVSSLRRYYDTRVYSRIYTLVSTRLIKNHKKEKIDNSTIVTRSNLVKELVDFFEHDLTEAYTSIIEIIGALIMIYIISSNVFFLCFTAIILTLIIYKLSEKKIYNENAILNKELENRLNIINKANVFLIPHFKKIQKSIIRLSDIEVVNYIFIQIFIAIIVIASVFIGLEDELTTGEVFALLTYVLTFCFEVLILPILFQQFIRLKEISHRINNKS